MKASREKIKLLIELSPTVEEADKIIEENYGFTTIAEKMAFLKGMFDVQVVSKRAPAGTSKERTAEKSYWTMLNAILVCPNTALKKSQITDWWIADDESIMAFINIFSGEPLSKDLLVVGYLDKDKRELATSTNRVVRVTKKGVITAKGTYYPFEEAHPLYLQFLVEVNKENTLIATNWKYACERCKREIIADIVRTDGIQEGVTFDFIPSKGYPERFKGYSKDLSAHVILTTFSKRNVCIRIAIPGSVKEDIYWNSCVSEEDILERVRLVQNIFAEKFN